MIICKFILTVNFRLYINNKLLFYDCINEKKKEDAADLQCGLNGFYSVKIFKL